MATTAATKREMRRGIAATLRALEPVTIAQQSDAIASRVESLAVFQRATALSVYLHMPSDEATTSDLLASAFKNHKKVYVPKITGRGAEDLRMVHAWSLEDIEAFPKDKWEIPDPPLTTADGQQRDDAMEALDIDLVLLPGVAFDRTGGRLGHGKGYYDSFLRRLGEQYAARGKPPPTLVGICLSAQLVDAVPLSPHDRMLDIIVTPDETIHINH